MLLQWCNLTIDTAQMLQWSYTTNWKTYIYATNINYVHIIQNDYIKNKLEDFDWQPLRVFSKLFDIREQGKEYHEIFSFTINETQAVPSCPYIAEPEMCHHKVCNKVKSIVYNGGYKIIYISLCHTVRQY